jgi:hypothetical protein
MTQIASNARNWLVVQDFSCARAGWPMTACPTNSESNNKASEWRCMRLPLERSCSPGNVNIVWLQPMASKTALCVEPWAP